MKKKQHTNLLIKSLVGICLILLLGTLTFVFSDEYVAPNNDPIHNAETIFFASDDGETVSIQKIYDDGLISMLIEASCADQTTLTENQIDKEFEYETSYTYVGFHNNHSLTNCLKVRP